jgi:hypothetical protein
VKLERANRKRPEGQKKKGDRNKSTKIYCRWTCKGHCVSIIIKRQTTCSAARSSRLTVCTAWSERTEADMDVNCRIFILWSYFVFSSEMRKIGIDFPKNVLLNWGGWSQTMYFDQRQEKFTIVQHDKRKCKEKALPITNYLLRPDNYQTVYPVYPRSSRTSFAPRLLSKKIIHLLYTHF